MVQFTALELIQFLIIMQSLLMAIFVLKSPQNKQKSNQILGTFLGLITCQMLGLIFINKDINRDFFINLNYTYGFSYGALIYFYTRSLTRKSFNYQRIYWLHFVPSLILLSLAVMNITPAPQLFLVYSSSILIYSVASFREIFWFQKIVQQTRSSVQNQNLNWLKLAICLFSSVILTDILSLILDFVNIHRLSGFLDVQVFVLLWVFINVMIYKGLTQPKLFTGIEEGEEEIMNQQTENKIPETQNWQAEIKKLERYFKEKKTFLDADLTLNRLAEQLELSPRNLSQLINQNYQTNFSDFINTHCIEEAKIRLLNPKDEKETVLEIMYDVGFNSKFSFNTIFRKKTGLIPTQFKKKRT